MLDKNIIHAQNEIPPLPHWVNTSCAYSSLKESLNSPLMMFWKGSLPLLHAKVADIRST